MPQHEHINRRLKTPRSEKFSKLKARRGVSRSHVALSLVVAAFIAALIATSTFSSTLASQASQSYGTSTGAKVTQTESALLNNTQIVKLSNNLAINVTVRDPNGTITGSIYEPHDLITNNFYNYFLAFFLNAASAGQTTVALHDTSNTVRTNYMWGVGGGVNYGTGYTGVGSGGLIEVGTSSTAATRADYQLNAPYQTFFTAITTACATSSSSSSFTVGGSVNAQSSNTITEAGLFVQTAGAQGVATQYDFLMAHDVFSGISVTSGQTITVLYTWTLNSAGLNRNLCNYLAGWFNNVNFGQGTTNIREPAYSEVLFATIGANVTWAIHCGVASSIMGLTDLTSPAASSTSCVGWSAAAQTENAIYMAVGTGSGGSGGPFTPTTNALTTFNHQSVTTTTYYDAAGDLFITAANVLSSSATINEAAIYITLPNGCEGYSPNHTNPQTGSCTGGYTTLTTMWMAAAFSGVSVTGSNPIGVTFEWSG